MPGFLNCLFCLPGGIGVADIMKNAGLTHDGFYGPFESKDDLPAQACARAIAMSADRWTTLVGRTPSALATVASHGDNDGHPSTPAVNGWA